MRILKASLLVFAAVALFSFPQADPWRPGDFLDASTAHTWLSVSPRGYPVEKGFS